MPKYLVCLCKGTDSGGHEQNCLCKTVKKLPSGYLPEIFKKLKGRAVHYDKVVSSWMRP